MADRQSIGVCNLPPKESGEIGNKTESAIAPGAVHGEISAVKSEDGVNGFAIGQMNERSISELRPHGFVFLQKVGDGASFQTRQRKHRRYAFADSPQHERHRTRKRAK